MTQPLLKFRSSHGWHDQAGDRVQPDFVRTTAEQTNRRRRRVFLGTLTIALALSLAFTWLRPPEYRATALLQITAASESPALRGAAGSAPESAKPFLTEVQVLTSRPILEAANGGPARRQSVKRRSSKRGKNWQAHRAQARARIAQDEGRSHS